VIFASRIIRSTGKSIKVQVRGNLVGSSNRDIGTYRHWSTTDREQPDLDLDSVASAAAVVATHTIVLR
jgi:hypothetical protein